MPPNRKKPSNKKGRTDYRQIGLLGTIPFIIAVSPLIGYFIGGWIDKKLGTDPIFMVVFIGLGLAAAVKETVKIIKEASRDPEK